MWNRVIIVGLLLCIVLSVRSGRASTGVYLNEISLSEGTVEVYNATPTPVNLSGWRIVVETEVPLEFAAAESCSLSGSCPPGEHCVVPCDGFTPPPPPLGGRMVFIDVSHLPVDALSFGFAGSAPVAPVMMSMCRAPDASEFTPPPPDAASDGLYWTLDFTPTFGGPNDAPNQALGSSILINEVSMLSMSDGMELYNPTPFPVPLAGFVITNGISVATLSGIVSPGGYHAFPVPFDIAASELLYLFAGGGVRLDQQGYDGHPGTGNPCFGRCPNGVGPSIGYDWLSSGGGVNLLVSSCTPGGPNPPCTTDVPDEPTEDTTWGALKARFSGVNSR